MPSPFPGMDPYLEHPDFWQETHHLLISEIAASLVPQIRPKYEIAIDKRIYEITEPNDSNSSGDSLLVGIPDVAIKRQSNRPDVATGSVATVAVTLPATVKVPTPAKIKQAYLEVREMTTKQVVTAIEILSPVNKRSGDRVGYKSRLRDRRECIEDQNLNLNGRICLAQIIELPVRNLKNITALHGLLKKTIVGGSRYRKSNFIDRRAYRKRRL
ncbi:MAG: DUF4058 family protein [Microcoleus sp.]